MTEILVKGRELYAALAAGDIDALTRLLSADFQAQLTEGLPQGFGRSYDGLDSMMSDGWGAVDRWFEMSPHPEKLIDGGDVLVGLGSYVGTAKPTGKPLRAAFAHFWRFDGEQFTAVRQVTDSGKWRDALERS
jgi:2-(1,2-epoxy-1,2-dihydrophenyl)acetyl-CoA isomerase